jgi:DNA invertase Pin-like site-specific DNA recombinase
MSAGHSTNGLPLRAVAYFRKSNEDGGESVEQQRQWAVKTCPEENIEIVREFADQGKPGHENAKRTDFHEMLRFCQQQYQLGTSIDAVVCWNPNRFSRADSQETGWYVWEIRKSGVSRMFSASNGWIDFDRMEDRILSAFPRTPPAIATSRIKHAMPHGAGSTPPWMGAGMVARFLTAIVCNITSRW